jgi:hypothetical protein
VETPVQRIIIFTLAVRTHGKLVHGSLGSIVRNIFDDGEPGAAVGTVYEWITIAPIGYI